MQGTPHEKAALVITSYIIGFTAAFILFADYVVNSDEFISEVDTSNSVASIIAAAPAPVAVPVAQVAPVSQLVTYKNGLLEVRVGESESLLSFNPENSIIKADLETLTQGYHYGEIVYKVSPDQKFVFFCEAQDPLTNVCAGYVYDINADRIFPVIKNGAQPLISAASAASVSWSTVGLTIGTNSSANASAPWVLIGE